MLIFIFKHLKQFIVADAENEFECVNAGYYEVREYVDQGMRLYIYFFPAPSNGK